MLALQRGTTTPKMAGLIIAAVCTVNGRISWRVCCTAVPCSQLSSSCSARHRRFLQIPTCIQQKQLSAPPSPRESKRPSEGARCSQSCKICTLVDGRQNTAQFQRQPQTWHDGTSFAQAEIPTTSPGSESFATKASLEAQSKTSRLTFTDWCVLVFSSWRPCLKSWGRPWFASWKWPLGQSQDTGEGMPHVPLPTTIRKQLCSDRLRLQLLGAKQCCWRWFVSMAH